MRHRVPTLTTLVGIIVASALISAADYKITVSQDRLNNAINEPQNWLLMNGDYGATRYSKLTQINRDNVKNLRMVWAMALGGMQDVGQNGPENEVNPLIDNGAMYTSDGWGTIYKIDASSPDHGKFLWVADTAVSHQGTRLIQVAVRNNATSKSLSASGSRVLPRCEVQLKRFASQPSRPSDTAQTATSTSAVQ